MIDTLSCETLDYRDAVASGHGRMRPVVRGSRPLSRQPARLRLTRRGRLTILVIAIVAMFVAVSIGRVMTSAATSSPRSAATHTIVVSPGDTAWSIAHQAMPDLDGREAVDRLLALNHSDGEIQVGQTLVVPGS